LTSFASIVAREGHQMKCCDSSIDRCIFRRAALWPAMLAALIGAGASPAGAQDERDASGLQFLVTPYVWAPHITNRVTTSLPQEATVTQEVDFDQLFTHLSWVPFMGSVEVRDGPFGGFVDYLHVPVRTGISTHDALFNGGTAGLVVDTATVDFLYRPIAQRQQYLDAGIGVRPWGVSTDLSLNSGLLPGRSLLRGGSWADPLLVMRYHRELGSGFGLTAYGDVGGFGLAAHVDWQVMGTIDYAARSWFDLHLGYRSLNVDYTNKHDVGFNVNMDGPIIAGTIRF
jgi:hypothetical protein